MTNLALATHILEKLAAQINSEHQHCQAAITFGLLHARNAGEWLLQAQAQLPPEKWLTWLAAYCTVSEQTAQTYMQIARGWPRLEASRTIAPLAVRAYLPSVTTFKREEFEQSDARTAKAKGVAQPPIAAIAEPVPEPVHPPSNAQNLNSTDGTLAAALTIATKNGIAIAPATFSFWIPGPVTPKARPRVTVNGTFLPKRYRQWRLRAEGEILMQLEKMNPQPKLPIQQAAVRIVLRGQHRGDGDNAISSVCDALVAVGVLPSDSLKHVPYGSWRHFSGEETGVQIQIKPLE